MGLRLHLHANRLAALDGLYGVGMTRLTVPGSGYAVNWLVMDFCVTDVTMLSFMAGLGLMPCQIGIKVISDSSWVLQTHH